MSPRRARRLLWGCLVLVVPVPILVVGPGWVPVVRLVLLGAVTLSVVVLESARGAVPALAAFLLGQAAGYGALLWLGAAAATRALRPLGPRALAPAVLALVAALAVGATLTDAYQDPYRPAALDANLLRLYW
jgi:hypothetical protein